eukprot:gene10884-3588_t
MVNTERREVSKEEFEACFGYTMNEACTILKIQMKDLKRLCRKYNVTKWPKKTKLDLNFMKVYKEENFKQKEKLPTSAKKKKVKKQTQEDSQKSDVKNSNSEDVQKSKVGMNSLLTETNPQHVLSEFHWMSEDVKKK